MSVALIFLPPSGFGSLLFYLFRGLLFSRLISSSLTTFRFFFHVVVPISVFFCFRISDRARRAPLFSTQSRESLYDVLSSKEKSSLRFPSHKTRSADVVAYLRSSESLRRLFFHVVCIPDYFRVVPTMRFRVPASDPGDDSEDVFLIALVSRCLTCRSLRFFDSPWVKISSVLSFVPQSFFVCRRPHIFFSQMCACSKLFWIYSSLRRLRWRSQ